MTAVHVTRFRRGTWWSWRLQTPGCFFEAQSDGWMGAKGRTANPWRVTGVSSSLGLKPPDTGYSQCLLKKEVHFHSLAYLALCTSPTVSWGTPEKNQPHALLSQSVHSLRPYLILDAALSIITITALPPSPCVMTCKTLPTH